MCTVLGYDPESGFIDRATAGLREIDRFTPPDPEAYRRRFLDQPGPIVIQDALEDDLLRRSSFVQREGIRTAVVYRLLADGDPLGLLFANYRRLRVVTEEDLRAIRILGDIAAAVLRETKLQRQLSKTEKRLQRLTVLIWISMLEDSWRHSLVGKASTIRVCVGTVRQRLRTLPPTTADAQEIASIIGHIDELAIDIANAPVRVPQSWEMQPELLPIAGLIAEVVRRTCKPAATLGSDGPINAYVELETVGGVQVSGHRRWLIYAFECLLQNALNALISIAGGTITVSGQRNGEWVEVRIIDTGPGIPEEVRPYLFSEPPPKGRDDSGRGMGAMLARSIIEEEEGTVELERSDSTGTTILVRLKVANEGWEGRQ